MFYCIILLSNKSTKFIELYYSFEKVFFSKKKMIMILKNSPNWNQLSSIYFLIDYHCIGTFREEKNTVEVALI